MMKYAILILACLLFATGLFLRFGGTGTAYDASCMRMTVPETVGAGESFTASIMMRNSGTAPWTKGGLRPYYLGAQNPAHNVRWGISRIELPIPEVHANVSVGFSIVAVAPPLEGAYAFDWQMVRGDALWFGEACRTSIVVVGGVPSPVPTPTPLVSFAPSPTTLPPAPTSSGSSFKRFIPEIASSSAVASSSLFRRLAHASGSWFLLIGAVIIGLQIYEMTHRHHGDEHNEGNSH